MFVDHVDVSKVDDARTRVSADVAGHEVWFELPTEHFRGSVADALACMAFFPAMAQGSTTETVLSMPEDLQVSDKLLQAFPEQQDTFGAWARRLGRFQPQIVDTDMRREDKRVISSFSGGVDSLYTALTRTQEITHLVHIVGYELTLDKDPEAAALPRVQAMAARLDKELIVVRTNALSVYRELKIQRLLIFGVFMATVAHLLGPRRFYVPSSAPLHAMAHEGSSAYTDPRWSSRSVDIVYDINDFDRIEKMRQVGEMGYLDDVIVCHYNFSRNCCRCLKCVRTMLGIELQGLDASSFSEPLTTKTIRNLGQLDGRVEREMFGRYLTLGRQLGRRDLVRAMAYTEIKYRLKEMLRLVISLVDDFLLGGRLHRWHLKRQAQDSRSATWFEITPP